MDFLSAAFTRRFRSGGTVRATFVLPAGGVRSVAILGPSGAGKTTVLRCLSGLDHPEVGRIVHGDEVWFDSGTGARKSPRDRAVGALLQGASLFPHLDVAGNIAFGLRSLARAERTRRVAELLDSFGIAGLARRFPHEISGGQAQRVGLARTLARKPALLLLDEPFVGLDAVARRQSIETLRRVVLEFDTPLIFVTHDPDDALAIADRVLVMDDGTIVQEGSLDEVFSKPGTPTVAGIVGTETVLTGEVTAIADGLATVRAGTAELHAVTETGTLGPVTLCIRGDAVTLQRSASASSARNHLPAVVQSVEPCGPMYRIGLDAGFELVALVTRQSVADQEIVPGLRLTAVIKAPSIHLIFRPCRRPARNPLNQD